eukprot:scaffold189718_cov29-Tisochrysis_lutea.AAC.2
MMVNMTSSHPSPVDVTYSKSMDWPKSSKEPKGGFSQKGWPYRCVLKAATVACMSTGHMVVGHDAFAPGGASRGGGGGGSDAKGGLDDGGKSHARRVICRGVYAARSERAHEQLHAKDGKHDLECGEDGNNGRDGGHRLEEG